MINRIIHFSVYHRYLVLLMTAAIALIGLFSYQKLPIDAVPDITNNQVQVATQVEGLIPEEIERSITYPVESAMSGIAGVTQVRSITRFGISLVTVVFEDDVDIYRARQMVSERIAMVASELPPGTTPKLGPVTTGLGEIFHYALKMEKKAANGEEKTRQLMELKNLQDWYIKPRLLTVKGVAEVNTIGGYETQYHVQPRASAMAKYGVHFKDIQAALESSNKNVGGGYVEQTSEQFLVQAKGLFRSIKDIESVPVRSLESFKTVTIGDIASVRIAKELRTGAALVNGEEVVIGSVLMLIGENSRTVSSAVGARVKEIAKGLPTGVQLEVVYDRSELVNSTLRTVLHNLVTGAALVVVILLLLVGNARAALITAFVIPLSLLITFILMKLFNISGNLMSLGALDFGIIVDGAVIVIDNCVRHVSERTQALQRKLSRAEIQELVYNSAVEIRKAAGFGELIIVVVFLPIFALVGIEGKMFRPMAATFCFAILGALVLSFTTVPALASVVFSSTVKDKEPFLMRWLHKVYEPALHFVIHHRKKVVGVGVASFLVGIALFVRLGGEFLPQLDENAFSVQLVRPVNISLTQAVRLEEITQNIIKRVPEVQSVFGRLGTSEVATDPMGVNNSDTYVPLKPRDQWPKVDGRIRTKEEIVTSLARELEETVPGQRFLISQPIEERMNEIIEGTRADITVKVFGDDMKTLSDLTEKIAGVIRSIKGAGDVELELKGTSPLLQITPKEGALKGLGVPSLEVLDTVGIAVGGREAGYIYDGIKRYPIIVRLNSEERGNLDAIRKLPVGIGPSTNIPLKDVANIEFTEAYSSISREESKRRGAVLINLRGRDTSSFIEEAQRIVAEKVKFPSGYYAEWGGNFKNLEEASMRLSVLTPIALLLILMMIYAAFQSVSETILIFSCVPLALVGGVLGLILNGLPFSISAGVGFIALSGIAVLNGVVLVNYFNQLKREGVKGEELVTRGALLRLRPVLMTALVDIFGFLPMMLSHGLGAEVQKPLASVVVGGIVSSTILTLLVLPSLYLIFERFGEKKAA